VSNAVVTAGFYSKSVRCGLSTSPVAPITAGTRTSFVVSGINLSDESTVSRCTLPTETTQLVVQVWQRDRPASPLLSQEFAQAYTFTEP
jgi:hypothetical protein